MDYQKFKEGMASFGFVHITYLRINSPRNPRYVESPEKKHFCSWGRARGEVVFVSTYGFIYLALESAIWNEDGSNSDLFLKMMDFAEASLQVSGVAESIIPESDESIYHTHIMNRIRDENWASPYVE